MDRAQHQANEGCARRMVLTLAIVFLITSSMLPKLGQLQAQTLLNVDFGPGSASQKVGFAATGRATNDVWNLYSHYRPRFQPGMDPVPNGRLDKLLYADGTECPSVVLTVTNAPGVWGNATGDAMLDSYIFAPNGSNIVVTVEGMDPGQYQVYLYGWAAADVGREQIPSFLLRCGTNVFGPIPSSGGDAWRAGQPWTTGGHFAVCRDIPIQKGVPVVVEVLPGPGGIAVINGLQILSRGTAPPSSPPLPIQAPSPWTNILFRSVVYDGTIGSATARFHAVIEAESKTTNTLDALLLEGDVAVTNPNLPPGWALFRSGRKLLLHTAAPGVGRIELDLDAKPAREEAWSVVRFQGPDAALARATIRTTDPALDIQGVGGTTIEASAAGAPIEASPGAARDLGLRWRGKAAEAARDSMVAVDYQSTITVAPTAIRHNTVLRYEVLQSRLARVRIQLPANHALIKLSGDDVRDWRLSTEADKQILTVDFLRPVESGATVTLLTEQPVTSLPGEYDLLLPQPLDVHRETGALRVRTEDIAARLATSEGLRQVNAADQEFAAFRFNSRPASLRLGLSRIDPWVESATRVRVLVEENRWTISHEITVSASRAGIYTIDLLPQPGMLVADVRGEDLDSWETGDDGHLRINLAKRLLGEGRFTVQLEQPLAKLPPELNASALRVLGAARETALLGVRSTPGLQLKTASVSGMREIPAGALPSRQEELLAYRSEAPDWKLGLAAERLTSRVVAEVFNLVTIGDGMVGGSATIRLGIVNQGVDQVRIRVPKHWRNLEFTGPNIRRKDQREDVWTIALQDKSWGGYTLVATYDFAFDPKRATLDAGGAHVLDVERETGTVAVTSAADLALEAGPIAEPLRRIDPTELAPADRSIVSRPVLLAYRYEGNTYGLTLLATRHEDVQVLDAVADRAELTSVLTGSGEMLTQASFLVKNNERQYQRIELPTGATLWGVALNGEPVKADQDGNWVLVGLPREEDRDRTFAIDIKYAQQFGALGSVLPKTLRFTAPRTDVPGTYAEWQIYAPTSRHVFGFEGNMRIVRGAPYGWRDGWRAFTRTYANLWHENGETLVLFLTVTAFLAALVAYGRRKGTQGLIGVFVVFALVAIFAGMLLPALGKAKSKAQRINSANNLKQIGIAARLYATDHGEKLPKNFGEMMSELGTEKVTFDPVTGDRYTYVGAGKTPDDPTAILAYSPERSGGRRDVVLVDGSVQFVSASAFLEAVAKDAALVGSLSGRAAGPVVPQPPPQMQGQVQVQEQAQVQTRGASPVGAVQPPTAAALNNVNPNNNNDAANVAAAGPPIANPGVTASGIKSLRFDLPRSGKPYQFTKVLSLSGEPPTVSMGIMSLRAYVFLHSLAQLGAFLAGLALLWWQWSSKKPRPVWFALGGALTAAAGVDLLISWQALGLALNLLPPALALLLVILIGRRFMGRKKKAHRPDHTPPTPTPTAATGLATVIALLLLPQMPMPQALSAGPVPAVAQISETGRAAIEVASYRGAAGEKTAQIDVELIVVSSGTNATLALFGKEVAVRQFACTNADVQLVRLGNGVGLLLSSAVDALVQMKVSVALQGDLTRRELDFGIPPALGGSVVLSVNEPDAEIDFPDAVALERATKSGATEVHAVLGPSERLHMSWTPKRKRAADMAATVYADQATLFTVGDGVVHAKSFLDWQISQGELQQLRLRLPPGHKLLRITGDRMKSWTAAPTNAALLTVELVKPVSPSVRMVVETERAIETMPADISLMVPQVEDVKRQIGSIAIAATEELDVNVKRAVGMDRIDTVEFTKAFGPAERPVISAWHFLQTSFELQLGATLLQPRLEAVDRQHFLVGLDQLTIVSRVEFLRRVYLAFQAFGLAAVTRSKARRLLFLRSWSWKSRVDFFCLRRRGQASQAVAKLTARRRNMPRTVKPLAVRTLLRSSSSEASRRWWNTPSMPQ